MNLTEYQIAAIHATAKRMGASPENVLKRAIGSYCAKFGGDAPIRDPDQTNVTALAVDNRPVNIGDCGDKR